MNDNRQRQFELSVNAKLLLNIFFYGCMLVMVMLVVSCHRINDADNRNNFVWHTADVKGRKVVVWDGASPIPLSTDLAIERALAFLNDKYDKENEWVVNRLELAKEFDIWVYYIRFEPLTGDASMREAVRVLLDGTVWIPRPL